MLFIYSFFLFMTLVYLFKLLAIPLRLIDEPNFRKKHKGSVPVIGGIVIYINLFFFNFFIETNYYYEVFLYSSSLLIILGAIDDAIEIGVIFRLINQLICCLIVIGSGLMITDIGDYGIISNIDIGILSLVFTVICVIGLTNSFNFIDGADGLCSGLFLISIFTIVSIIYLNGNFSLLNEVSFLIFICFTITLFIFLNITKFNKIFLGDSGSTFLGFFISWLLIFYSQGETQLFHPVLAIWCVTFPVLDLFSVVIRRLLRKSNPFKPDRRHVHHILKDLGLSSSKSVIYILLSSLFLNIFGYFVFYNLGALISLISFIVILILYISLMVKLSRLINSN